MAPKPLLQHLSIRQAQPGDLPALQYLLSLCDLPVEGVADELDTFLVACDGSRLAGSIGIERYGTNGLLRSLAVHPDYRRRGLGTSLTRRALGQARRLGLRRVFLLTETAADYFLRFRFQRTPREQAPPAVRTSAEFASACPETAICMERRLA